MSLYLEHFGLREAPFKITPHIEFFFSGGQRGALLQALHYAVMHEEGVIKVSGAVGSGKTMLCRMLGERLQNEADVIYLADPALSRQEILGALAADLSILPSCPPDALTLSCAVDIPSPSTPRLRALQDQLIARYAQGRRVVLIIDEAHAMPAESLEEIRLLSNLESNQHKLLQIVLFGQEELDHLLLTQQMRPLRDRITQTFRLSPFSSSEVANYLAFRLGAAGCKMPGIFTPAAAHLIAKASRGLTRRINLLADKALLAAYNIGSTSIQRQHIKEAIADCELPYNNRQTSDKKQWSRLGASFLLFCGIAVGAIFAWMILHTPSFSNPIEQARILKKPIPLPPTAIQSAIQRGLNWLTRAPDTQASLQLMVLPLSAQADIERFLQQHNQPADSTLLSVYPTQWNNMPALAVLYGTYDSITQATAQIHQLPPEFRALQPQVRLVREIRQTLRTDAATSPIPAN